MKTLKSKKINLSIEIFGPYGSGKSFVTDQLYKYLKREGFSVKKPDSKSLTDLVWLKNKEKNYFKSLIKVILVSIFNILNHPKVTLQFISIYGELKKRFSIYESVEIVMRKFHYYCNNMECYDNDKDEIYCKIYDGLLFQSMRSLLSEYEVSSSAKVNDNKAKKIIDHHTSKIEGNYLLIYLDVPVIEMTERVCERDGQGYERKLVKKSDLLSKDKEACEYIFNYLKNVNKNKYKYKITLMKVDNENYEYKWFEKTKDIINKHIYEKI